MESKHAVWRLVDDRIRFLNGTTESGSARQDPTQGKVLLINALKQLNTTYRFDVSFKGPELRTLLREDH